MKLLSARITGFRSFGRTVEFWFHPGLNGLVGPDRCGKTSVIEALLWAFGEPMPEASPEDMIFRGTDALAMADSLSVELELAEVRGRDSILLVSRSLSRGHRLSRYRIDGVTFDGDEFPREYAGIPGHVRWFRDCASLEAAAMDPPSGKILFLDELDSALESPDYPRHCDAVAKLRETNQVVFASHLKRLMALADNLFGVTMMEYGISKIVGMRYVGDPK